MDFFNQLFVDFRLAGFRLSGMRSLGFILLTFVGFTPATFGQRNDSLHLPFAISGEKKISEEELKEKKEGYYVTGLPFLSSDPLNGIGAGAEAQLFYNGHRNDPFFAYTPFRAEFDLTVFYTSKEEKEIKFECEIPYIFNSKWRLHGELAYEVDPNLLYFGLGERSLSTLSNPFLNKHYSTFDGYQNSLTAATQYYNTYQKEEAVFNIILHRSFMEGRMRFFMGFEIARSNYTTPLDNQSMFYHDFLTGMVSGYGVSVIPLFQPGLIFDTRDLETDPNKGSFAELIGEVSPPILGSPFNFTKVLAHYNWYHKVLPATFKRLVFASRVGINVVSGNAPYFEYTDAESSEKTITLIGGPVTLRGYKQSRFTGSIMDFANAELRYRFWQTNILKQHLTFNAVPFLDAGGVWDSFQRMGHLENYRMAEGLGLRIGWNENTTLRFDYAVSNEDQQFFFQFGHTF